MRKLVALLLVVVCLPPAVHPLAASRRGRPPRRIVSPTGQVSVVTLNAQQVKVLGLRRFVSMLELAEALRRRPEAFDGGKDGAVTTPDVLIFQEIRPTNVEILERLLRQRFGVKYRIAGESDTAAVIIYNSGALTLESFSSWTDVCAADGEGRRGTREYPIVRFQEAQSLARFTVAGIHLPKSYRNQGGMSCLVDNVVELKEQLAEETGAVIVGGDFNRRPTTEPYECDPNEDAIPMAWWMEMTRDTPTGEEGFVDAVKHFHINHGSPMRYEWTHEQATKNVACDGDSRIRRTRIDYLFASGGEVAEAHADHPGWAAPVPGRRHRHNFKYSDHRWVWGRFVISGPPRTPRPQATAGAGGAITLTWPELAADGFVVLRALPGRAYKELRRLPAGTTSFTDTRTRHAQGYRYSLVATGGDGGHSRESPAARAVADARGPHVTATSPPRRGRGVDPGGKILVRFDERFALDGVGEDTIKLFVDGRRVRGRTNIYDYRSLRFNPASRLRPRTSYRVVVQGVPDKLGNTSPRYSWFFVTAGRR